MRKVVVYLLLSLDGVAEKPDGFVADWDDAMEANLGAVISAQDAVILGRRSYDEWAEFWPASDIEPFAPFINGVAKIRRHLDTARSEVDQYDRGRRRPGRVRPGAEEATRGRHRRACKHLGRPSPTWSRRRRRAQSGDRTGDRGQRAEAPRRLAGHSARVASKHDLTDRLPTRPLQSQRVGEQPVATTEQCCTVPSRAIAGSPSLARKFSQAR